MPAMRHYGAVVVILLQAFASVAVAQNEPPPDVERAIREGKGETLDQRFGGGKAADEMHWIAQAFRAQGAAATRGDAREKAFGEAEKRYRKWIAEVEKASSGERERRAVMAAAAHAELGEMILQQWLVPELDEFEFTSGMRGDRQKLTALLERGAAEYARARDLIAPLLAELPRREEEFLALGIQQVLGNLRIQTVFHQAWAQLLLGQVQPADSPKRGEALRSAEAAFNAIINGGATGVSLHQSYLGLGIALRESKRYEEAERQFKNAMPEDAEPQIAAQARYEWGRTLVLAGRYEEGRTMLRPLAERDPEKLAEGERGLLFYVNLAKLWDAYSYLLDAEGMRREAARNAAQRSAAQQTRDAGLAKLLALSERGGPWPRVAALYATASADPKLDAGQRSALDLYFMARKLADEKRWPEARDKLRAALERPGLSADMQALLLFDLGWALYEGKELRPAAEAFARVARDHKRHVKAPLSAQYAYQLYGRVADQSKASEDYQLLADVVLNLVQSFPDHPQRVEAMWLLPLALQGAGRFAEAADQFAKVPKDAPRFEEAQYRRTLCLRRAYEAEKLNLAAEQRTARGQAVAAQMAQYAQQAHERASGTEAAAVRNWSAEALVGAAELLLGEGVNQYAAALEVLRDFEVRYKGSPSLGRALAARIRAYRGLRQMDAATRTVQEFLASAPADQSDPVLLSVAQGIEEELDRLRAEQRDEELRKLATDALPLFERLEAWCGEDPARAANAPVVAFGLARLYYTAGRHEQAAARIEKLLAADPQNGNLRRLQAQVLTAGLAADERGAKLESAKRAWAELLKDDGLRSRAPERYWEARYNYLRLLLQEGQATAVEQAIRQERIWYPDLGGPAWAQRFEALAKAAAERVRNGE